MAVDIEILEDFRAESKSLVLEMLELLDLAESSPENFEYLEKYGQTVDRIMGGAKSLATNFAEDFPSGHLIHQLGDYAAVCKAVGYKASQIRSNEQFSNVCIAFLLDATELLKQIVQLLSENKEVSLTNFLNKTLIDRLHWINSVFKKDMRSSVGSTTNEAEVKKMKQTEIDDLLKKLGIG